MAYLIELVLFIVLVGIVDAGLPAVGLVIQTPKHTQSFSKGYANIARTRPRMRLRERWRIGGVSKALTGAVVLRRQRHDGDDGDDARKQPASVLHPLIPDP